MQNFNKNERQVNFNEIKGKLHQINEGEKYCNITLVCGHENPRYVNLVSKKPQFIELVKSKSVGDKVFARFYAVSHEKNGRWYTSLTLLSLEIQD